MLPVNGNQPLVPLVDDRFGFAADFIHRQHMPPFRTVIAAEAAVDTVVHTEVRAIEGSEKDDAVVVNATLHLKRRLPHLLQELRFFHIQQRSRLRGGQYFYF